MTALRSLVFMVLFYAWGLALSLLYLPLLLAPRRRMVAAARFWLKGGLFLLRTVCGLGHEIRGRENLPRGPLVIAAKHQSMWDTMIFHSLLDDPAYILKQELQHIPLFGWYLRKHGMIGIDRSAGAKALKLMMNQAKKAAAQGRQIVIFPEGTRTAPGDHRPYHSGVAMLYGGLDLPVVPVALNSGLFWGRRQFTKKPGTIVLEILPPMPAGLDRRAFVEDLQSRIEAASLRLQQEAQTRHGHPAMRPA